MLKSGAWYNRLSGKIDISDRVNSSLAMDFIAAVNAFIRSGNYDVIIDFRSVLSAYSNGILPIISVIDKLRESAYDVEILLPEDDNTRRFFRAVNWAHFLDPEKFDKSESYYDRHSVTKRYSTPEEQVAIVNSFMDVVLRSIDLNEDVIAGLEWSVNEITDNVLNHSESSDGGLFQAIVYPSTKTVNFTVCDGGQGIFSSLKEGYPNLRTDIQAINEAIKQGVTRNNAIGQGNGLAGTVNISMMTGGSFEIMSGRGRIYMTADSESRKVEVHRNKAFEGTVITANICTNSSTFSISKAILFDRAVFYAPTTVIDTIYEKENSDALQLIMKLENSGFGTRKSGSGIRLKTLNLLRSRPAYPIVVDWSGVVTISSSFADEFIGKLFLELGMLTFAARVRNINMNNLIMGLIDKAAAQRLTQEKDVE